MQSYDLTGGPAPVMADPITDDNARAAKAAMQVAVTTNPDFDAELRRVSARTGVPLDSVRAFPDDVKHQAAVESHDYQNMAQQFPTTAKFLSDVENARISHDDVNNMGVMETMVNSFKRGIPALKSMLPSINVVDQASGLARYQQIDARIASGEDPKKVLSDYGDYGLAPLPWQTSAQVLADWNARKAAQVPQFQQQIGTSAAELTGLQAQRAAIPLPGVINDVMAEKTWGGALGKIASHPLQFIAGIGPESLIQSAPGLALAIPAGIVGGPGASAAAIGGNSFLTDYASTLVDAMQSSGIDVSNPESIRQGLKDPAILAKITEQAGKHAAVVGAVDALSGGIASKMVLPDIVAGKLAARPFAQEMANIALQAPIQGVLGGAGELGGELYSGQDIQPGNVLAEVFGEFFGTPAEVVSAGAKRIHENVKQANEAQHNAQVLTEIAANAQESKVRERDVATFEQFIAQSAEGGPVQEVWIDAKSLNQSGVNIEQLAAASPSVREQLPEALATGGDIRIPVEEFASRLSGPEFAQALIPHLRTDPNAMSEVQAQEYFQSQGENLRAEVEQAMAKQENKDAFAASREKVANTMLEQLNQTGRFTADVNQAYANLVANFYAVQAARLGVTPEALAATYPLQVRAERMTGGQQLDQSNQTNGQPEQPTAQPITRIERPAGIGSWPADMREAWAKPWEAIKRLASDGKVTAEDAAAIKNMARERKGAGKKLAELVKEIKRRPAPAAPVSSAANVDTQLTSELQQPELGAEPPGARGSIMLGDDVSATPTIIALLKNADLSTFLHESGHFFLEVMSHISSQENAPQAVKDDMQAVMKWFGMEDLAAWKAMDFEQQRPLHEQFARGFEAYLFEGKSPNLEMQGVFQRFRAWLLNVYRSLTNLNVELTDEVRSVFDRMLATTDQIQEAESVRGYGDLFQNKPEFMSDDDWANYQALGRDASLEAIQKLETRSLRDMKWLNNARSAKLKELQRDASSKRAAVREEVAAEVEAEPINQARRFLRTGESVDQEGVETTQAEGYRLDSDALAEMYGGEGDKYALLDWKPLGRMQGKDGMHPDVVAEQFGFSSGDELVHRLLEEPSAKDKIEAITDQRMLERYGDLTDPQRMATAADEALHDEARIKFLAAELNALNKAVGQRQILARAAKQYAEEAIARQRVRDLNPSQYSAASARAARAADKAFKAGDLEQAAAEKRNQLINTYAAKAAHAARAEIDKVADYMNKFDRKGVRENLPSDYLDQIDALREKYDFSQQSNRAADRQISLRSWVQSRLNAGEIPVIGESLLSPEERAGYLAAVTMRDAEGELVYGDEEDQIKLLAEAIDRSARRSYRNMTVEELRGLRDTVKQIEHLGRLKDSLLTAQEERSYQAARNEIVGSIVDNAKASGKNTPTPNDWLGKKLAGLKQFGAAHIKVATWARMMDGGKDNGPVWRYLVQPANERATMETSMRAAATEKLDAILRPILNKVSITDKMGKGKFFPTLGRSLNWQERFAVALNTGNESNLQRLLGGDGWTMAQIQPVLQSLSSQEWQAVQAIWDHFESYRPLIAEKERRVTGVEPQWIPARPIEVRTSDGKQIKLNGGYFPVVYDPRVNLRAEQHASAQEAKDAMKAAYAAATTRRSFTKSRVDEVNGRPLLLNLQGLYSGVNDVIHDLAWHEWVIDANKLLRSTSIDSAIREHYGPEVKREFDKWRDDIVAGTRRLDHAIEKAAGWARQSVSASALTFNIMSAALQPLGLTNSISRTGASWVAKGLGQYVASPVGTTREVMTKSEWMTNRTRTRFRELNELRNQVQGQSSIKELMGRYGYWMMMRMQTMVDVPTWIAGYEKAISEGHDERTAVNLADQVVKDSQGGGEEVDQSGVERGGPLIKLFTAFYGFMGTTLNTTYLDAKTNKSKAKIAVNMVLTLMVPAIAGALIKDALTPGDSGDGDPEKLTKKLAAEQISFLLGLVAFGREFSAYSKSLVGEKSMGYSGPAGLRLIPDTGKLIEQAYQGEFDDAFRKAFVNWMGDLTGLPSVQINRTITGAQAISEGKTSNPAALAIGYQEKK